MATLARAQALDGLALHEAISAALAELELLAPGRLRSGMAEDLVRLLLGRLGQGDVVALRCLDRLLEVGGEHSPDRPGWPRMWAAGRLAALLRAADERELVDYRAAMYEVDRLATEFAADPGIRAIASMVQSSLVLASNPHDMATLHGALLEMGTLVGNDPKGAPILEMMRGLVDATQVCDIDDGAALASLLELVQRTSHTSDAPLVHRAAVAAAPMLELVQSLVAGVADGDLAAHDHRLDMLQELADRPGAAPTQRGFYLSLRGGAALRQGSEQNPARLGAAIADLRSGVTLTPAHHPDRVVPLGLLAWALSRRAEVTGALEDVDEAIALLEQARELAGGAGHSFWASVNDLLAALRHRRGDHGSQTRQIGLEGLRGHVWQVLLQPDAIAARTVARTAAQGATLLASRFLADQQPVDALRALDTGRGLMLFAATELRDPCRRLIEAGRPDLAHRWRTEQHPPPPVRQDVLDVLARDAGLLDPPDLGEIQSALRALGADALIYLVPAGNEPWGWAVIAPAQGEARYLALPHLVIEAGTDIERYLTAMATRDLTVEDAGEEGDTARTEFVDSVEALCGWAWKAAMGPIVTPYLDGERVPHLVIIPMGDLARVPWQAARGPDGRYLIERVALSQAASARMLCDTAAAEPVRLTPAGLIVADPDTGGRARKLPAARLEAYAIRESFYPAATYLGRLPRGAVSNSGAGTPEDVRAWLRADGVAAGAMLHLASHGVMDTELESASSRLVLAEGDLTADELIDVLGGSPHHPIGLVVLAACHTGRSIHGYDEAYSLATMFLAAGVRSVLSTQWSVPDQDTSLLMYLFHHYLVIEHRPPWDALRRAQMWMLDDARSVPDRMPEPLRRALDGSDPRRVAAWAGFVHWGQ
jgi:hypothetical protein